MAVGIGGCPADRLALRRRPPRSRRGRRTRTIRKNASLPRRRGVYRGKSSTGPGCGTRAMGGANTTRNSLMSGISRRLFASVVKFSGSSRAVRAGAPSRARISSSDRSRATKTTGTPQAATGTEERPHRPGDGQAKATDARRDTAGVPPWPSAPLRLRLGFPAPPPAWEDDAQSTWGTRLGPGLPSSTTKLATVVAPAAGSVMVDTARRSVRTRPAETSMRA